jgi:hypothetical protein
MQTDPEERSEAAAMTLGVWAARDEGAALASFDSEAHSLDVEIFLKALPRTGHIGTAGRAAAYGGAGNISVLQDRANALLSEGSPP